MDTYMAESETQWTSLWADEDESKQSEYSVTRERSEWNKSHAVLCVLQSSDFSISLAVND